LCPSGAVVSETGGRGRWRRRLDEAFSRRGNPVPGLDTWIGFADAWGSQPTHLADGAPRTEPGPGCARVLACHTPGRPAVISMDAIGSGTVTPVDAIESPFPVIRIHVDASAPGNPIRMPQREHHPIPARRPRRGVRR